MADFDTEEKVSLGQGEENHSHDEHEHLHEHENEHEHDCCHSHGGHECENEDEHEHDCCHSHGKHEHEHDCDCEDEHEHGHHHGHHHGHSHSHGHHHHCACGGESHGDDDDEEEETSLGRIIVAAVLFVLALLVEKLPVFALGGAIAHGNEKIFLGIKIVYMALYFCAYILCGLAVLREAVEGLLSGHVFGEEFLMAVATVGALVMGEYSEATAVMILFQLGEYLEDLAVGKSRKNITALMDVRPDMALVRLDDTNEVREVKAKSVLPGQTIIVNPGDRIPLDGTVTKGTALLDTSALTGESVPREVMEGDDVLSGCVNTSSAVLEIKVTKPFEKSTASRILELVEEAQEKKAKSEKFISRFAKVYTPLVCLAALLLAIVPPLVMQFSGNAQDGMWKTWVYRALELLVVSCPCALVISVPLTFFAGIGLASRKGILFKGSSSMELMESVKTVVFDKTGTLTKGVFEVSDVHVADPALIGEQELVALATHAEYYSKHPISLSLKNAHKCPLCAKLAVENAQEISGCGLKCTVEGHTVLAGNTRLMEREGITGLEPCAKGDFGTIVHVARDGVYLGHIIISDKSKEDSAEAVKTLKRLGVENTVMLTGDIKAVALEQGKKLGIDEVHAELLPDQKVAHVEQLLAAYQGSKNKLAFAGDGINDAPVLTRSDVGIAMGAIGSDAAIEAADVVIMNDSPMQICEAVKISRRTMLIVRENVILALGIKTLIMVLCGLGIANMWLAVFGDVGVTMLAVLNSMRLHWRKR